MMMMMTEWVSWDGGIFSKSNKDDDGEKYIVIDNEKESIKAIEATIRQQHDSEISECKSIPWENEAE